VFASIRNPDAPTHPAARPRTAIRLLFGEALVARGDGRYYHNRINVGTILACDHNRHVLHRLDVATCRSRGERSCGQTSAAAQPSLRATTTAAESKPKYRRVGRAVTESPQSTMERINP
jgi:hypothetical protein